MKHLFVKLYAYLIVAFISIVIGMFIFNIIGDMSKEVENAEVAFESLEKAILNEVKASQLEDVSARQKLRRIANTLAIKGFVVQLAPSKGAVFSYPPDSSLFAIVNGNVFVKEESKFLKVFRTEDHVKIGEENKIIHMTMIRSILPVQMIFLRSRTVVFLMVFVVLMTIGMFLYLRLNESDKVERVYTDFVSPSEVSKNSATSNSVRQKYTFDDVQSDYEDVKEPLGETSFHHKNSNSDSLSANHSFYTSFADKPVCEDVLASHSSNLNAVKHDSSIGSNTFLSSLSPFDLNTADTPEENSGINHTQAEHQLNGNQLEILQKEDKSISHPLGLYSPKTGLGWKEYVEDRLDSELGKATVIDQDISFVIIKILDVDYASLELKRLADIMLEVFRFKDMIFEYSDEQTLGFAAILQDAYVDEAVRVCNSLFSKFQHEIFLSGQEPTIKMGITTRACRLIGASDIIKEAEKALDNAMQNETEAIVGYQPSAEKYKQHSIENDR